MIVVMKGYTIGALARAAGVAASTVRFYERRGLLKPEARSEGNYRQYGESSLERLRFIRSAQGSGFSLEDVRALLGLVHSDEPPCEDVETVTRKRLGEVREKISELKAVEKALARSLEKCCSGDKPDLCEKITKMGGKRCGPKEKCR